MFLLTEYEGDEEVCGDDYWELYVERVDNGVTLDDLGGGEDEGEGEEDVLHTVEDDEEAVLSPDSLRTIYAG